MPWIVWVGALSIGAVFGSFLNVCIYRWPRGESLVYPGSHCPRCGAKIRWWDNIPLISYLALLGRCRACKSPISPRYPIVEGLTAVLCLLLVLRHGVTPSAAVYCLFCFALLVVAFIDLDYQIIPNRITYPGILLGVCASFILPEMTLRDALIGIAVGGGILTVVALLFEWIRKKEGMGFGDVKLLAMIGAFLGWKAVALTLLVSSVVGLLVGYAALRLAGKGTEHPIPFGPFLCLGALVYLLGGDVWVDWYLGLGGV